MVFLVVTSGRHTLKENFKVGFRSIGTPRDMFIHWELLMHVLCSKLAIRFKFCIDIQMYQIQTVWNVACDIAHTKAVKEIKSIIMVCIRQWVKKPWVIYEPWIHIGNSVLLQGATMVQRNAKVCMYRFQYGNNTLWYRFTKFQVIGLSVVIYYLTQCRLAFSRTIRDKPP